MNADNDAPNVPGLPENAYRPLAPGERYEPIVPAARALAEITSRSIVFGLAMTALFSAAAAFIALKLGQGIEIRDPDRDPGDRLFRRGPATVDDPRKPAASSRSERRRASSSVARCS